MKSERLNSGIWILIGITIVFFLPVLAFGGADVAVYDDTAYPDGGAWPEGLTAIRSMLDTYGYSHVSITPNEINLTIDLASIAKVILFGGGWAGGYNTHLNYQGYEHLRQFISRGGGYFGICAGAYLACDWIVWKPDFLTRETWLDYPLNLFSGIGLGAVIGIKEWTDPTGCQTGITEGAAITTIHLNSPYFPDFSDTLSILYYGGPTLISNGQHNVLSLATYSVPGDPLDGMTAMMLTTYGNGLVFISGPHPEIRFDSSSCTLSSNSQGWELMHRVLQVLVANAS